MKCWDWQQNTDWVMWGRVCLSLGILCGHVLCRKFSCSFFLSLLCFRLVILLFYVFTVYLYPCAAYCAYSINEWMHAWMKIDSLVYIYSCLQCFDAVGWMEGRASAGGARFTKYLTTILRLSYDNAKVTIDLRRTSNLQNVLRRTEGFSEARFTCKVVRSSETVFAN